MKRAILRLTAEEFGRSCLNLGRADENIAVRVEIDLSRILAQEPTATAHINVENPSGTEYAAVTSMDGTKLIWDVTKADNTVEGTGCAQLTVNVPNGEVLKSAVAATRIGHSIRGEGPAPDPVQNWVDDATINWVPWCWPGKKQKKRLTRQMQLRKLPIRRRKTRRPLPTRYRRSWITATLTARMAHPGRTASKARRVNPAATHP